jgi:hypothetical protein
MRKAAVQTEAETTTPNRPSRWTRFWNVLKNIEEAVDYRPYAHLNDRLTRTENELQELRKSTSN